MTPREKTLAWILGAIMVFGVGGGGFYYGFYSPWSDMCAQIDTLETEVGRLEDEVENEGGKITKVLENHPRLKDWKKLSLPVAQKPDADAQNAHLASLRLDYSTLLRDLLNASGFKPGNTIVTIGRSFTNQAIPKLETKEGRKDAYKPVAFEISTQGKLEDLGNFLEMLHRVPLLHHVPTLKIENLKKSQSKSDLKMVLTVEGLMVPGAEKNNRLVPEKLAADAKSSGTPQKVLAAQKREYAILASANPFFQPDPPPAPPEPPAPPPAVVRGPEEDREEVLSGVKLTTISGDGRRWEAYVYDQNRGGRETKLRTSAAWSDFSIKDKYDNLVMKAKLLHIDPSYIVFQTDGELYLMRCGETFFPVVNTPLDLDALKQLGLEKLVPPKPEAPPKKDGSSKGDQKKEGRKPTGN